MASREEIIEMLSTLGAREREVLSLVCQGKLYREIAEELFITEGAVKSTMAHVYVKLGLDQLKTSQRRKRLFQEVCPALATGAIPPQSDEDRRLVVVPSERVRAMVEKDEKALIQRQQRALALRPGPSAEPPGRRIGCWQRLWQSLMIAGVIAGAIVLGGLLLMVAYNVLTEGEIRLPDFRPGAPETVVVTATPDAEQGIEVAEAAESEAEEPSATPAPTETPSPTDTPAPTETPVPPTDTPIPLPTSTPVGMVDEVHTVSGERSNTESGDGLNADPRSWYSTGVYVQEGDRLSINYLGGEWWIGKVGDDQFIPQTPTDAGGYTGREEDRVVAEMQVPDFDKCYVLRSAPIASLVGKIGENGPVFLVGNSYDEPANLTGILHLRINYNSRVGFAFHSLGHCPVENGGEISVRIEVIPRS